MLQHLRRALLALGLMILPLAGTGISHLPASTHAAQTITLTEEDYYVKPADALVTGLIHQYEAAHPGVTIRRTYVAGDLLQKVLRQAATRTLPDIVILDNPLVQDMASLNLLTNLGPYTAGWSQLAGYYKSSLSTATWKGKLYGIPVGNNCLALYYNKTLFRAAGIAHPPTTWAELRADAKLLTRGNTYGLAFYAGAGEGGVFNWLPFFWGNGGDLKHVDSKASIEALDLWAQMLKDGSVSKSVLNSDMLDQFIAGNVGMAVSGPWGLQTIDNLTAKGQVKNLDFGVVSIPRQRADMPPVSVLGGEVWTIPSTSTAAHQRAAWDFLRWAQNPARIAQADLAIYNLSAYGPANQTIVARHPLLKTFADTIQTSKARADVLGPLYPRVSAAISDAIQATLTGQKTAQQALQAAQLAVNAAMANP